MKKEPCKQDSLISNYVLVVVEVNLTVVVTVYRLKFHVFNFPLSNLNGKPKSIDTYGDDREERPFNAVAKELERITVELNAVTTDNGMLRFPLNETDACHCKTDQYEDSSNRSQSNLHRTDFYTFFTNAANKHNECNTSSCHDTDDEDHADPRTDKVEQATGKYAVIYLRLLEFFCLCHLFASFTPIRFCAKSVTL